MELHFLVAIIPLLLVLTPSLSFAIGWDIPTSNSSGPLTFDLARIGNVTLGKEIAADDTRLHQLTLDINKYQTDQNVGIETADDLKILHDMCSYAAAEQSIAGVINITPGECVGTEK
jgi:hypothetical protein